MTVQTASPLTLGCLGPSATFCEEAAQEYRRRLPGQIEIRHFNRIREVVWAVAEGKIHEGVVPLENSIEGTVNVTLDLLANEVDLKIRAEIVLPVEHHLLGKSGDRLEGITTVISHPQALAQCERFISRSCPVASWVSANSTAEAARTVAAAPSGWAAIASRRASEVYGLTVLAENISDVPCNQTRFVVLGRDDQPPTGRDKTSLVFALVHQPGSLVAALSVLASRGLNLTKIESRPSKRSLGEYWFFVDFEGHRRDAAASAALKELARFTRWYKVLGSYPVAGQKNNV
ncbi:MAG: prephenate dehydratase [Syntrophomonadaceae bacterium]|nr:prephenate dehydratase [Syntrophomonadaceae bacterium]